MSRCWNVVVVVVVVVSSLIKTCDTMQLTRINSSLGFARLEAWKEKGKEARELALVMKLIAPSFSLSINGRRVQYINDRTPAAVVRLCVSARVFS